MRRGLSRALLAGVGLGVVNSLSSGLGSPYGPVSLAPLQGVRVLECVAAWLGTAWAWALYAFVVGWLSRALRWAIVDAVLGLVIAVLAYYACDALLGVNEGLSSVEILLWSLTALVVGPAMSSAGWLAHRSSAWSVVPGLIAPTVMVLDTTLRPSGPDTIRPWAQWTVYLAAVVLATMFAARAVRQAQRRDIALMS